MTTTSIPREREIRLGRFWWLVALRGISAIILGIWAWTQPVETIIVLTAVMGIYLIADGILMGISSFLNRMWLFLIAGIVSVIIGGYVVTYPGITAAIAGSLLIDLLGVALLVTGVAKVFNTFIHRDTVENVTLYMLAGIFLVLFGVLIISSPLEFGINLVRIIGVFGILFGIQLLWLAMELRGIARRYRS